MRTSGWPDFENERKALAVGQSNLGNAEMLRLRLPGCGLVHKRTGLAEQNTYAPRSPTLSLNQVAGQRQQVSLILGARVMATPKD
jgi:hypothetical protein